MHRRALLATLGTAALGIAGCADDPGSRGSTTTPGDGAADADRTATEPTDTGKPVTFDALQPAVVELRTDRLAVSSSSSQYLFLEVGGSSKNRPPRDAFALRFDGREFAPVAPGNPPLYRERSDSPYDATTGAGWLLYELPETGTADGTRLTRGGEWEPSPAVRERLAAPPPDLRVSPSFPDAVEEFTEPTLTVTVANRGRVPTRFVAGLSRSGPDVARAPVARVSERVDAGTEKAVRIVDDFPIGGVPDEAVGDGTADVRYVLEWSGGSVEAGVEVVAFG